MSQRSEGGWAIWHYCIHLGGQCLTEQSACPAVLVQDASSFPQPLPEASPACLLFQVILGFRSEDRQKGSLVHGCYHSRPRQDELVFIVIPRRHCASRPRITAMGRCKDNVHPACPHLPLRPPLQVGPQAAVLIYIGSLQTPVAHQNCLSTCSLSSLAHHMSTQGLPPPPLAMFTRLCCLMRLDSQPGAALKPDFTPSRCPHCVFALGCHTRMPLQSTCTLLSDHIACNPPWNHPYPCSRWPG